MLLSFIQGLTDLNVRTLHSYRKRDFEQLVPLRLFLISALISRKFQKTVIFSVHIKLNISGLQ